MNRNSIDINCDLGEGIGNEALLMPLISSCNIACGVHAGDDYTMRETVQLAIQHHTRIGAHPSFPDRENFGRTEMYLPKEELIYLIKDQILTLVGIIKEYKGHLHHIKPHGALYNMASVNQEVAEAVLIAISSLSMDAVIYVPYNSVIANLALEKSVAIQYEAFADRNYNEDLTLVSRKLPNATLHDPEDIYQHVLRMIQSQEVKTIDGKLKKIKADTVCIHGDNPNAAEIVSLLVQKLKNNNIIIEKNGTI